MADKMNSQHNTIAESNRANLLDSGSKVGEQVGPVGSHNFPSMLVVLK